jgi:lipase chaperone LimK
MKCQLCGIEIDNYFAGTKYCSPCKVKARQQATQRYYQKLKHDPERRIALGKPPIQAREPHYDYKAALDQMIAKLHKARGNGMDMAQFRKWLMTPPGQYVLASINEALRQQEGWEQRFMDYSTGWRNRARQGNA